MDPAVSLLAADIIRLYRTLGAAGIQPPRISLTLAHDTGSLTRLAICLIRHAFEQAVPGAIPLYRGPLDLSYALLAPALCRSVSRYGDAHRQVAQRFARYSSLPARIVLDDLCTGQGVRLTINFDRASERWFHAHSLSQFWDIIMLTVAEIRRQETRLQARNEPAGI